MPRAHNAVAGHNQPYHDSSNDSQATTTTNDTDRIFTPPGSDSGRSSGHGNGGPSSQDSQLFQLSQLAAAQDKIPETEGGAGGMSRKRMADGIVKQHTRSSSSTSPVKVGGHSRNTSTVSMASTAGSRVGEVRTKRIPRPLTS